MFAKRSQLQYLTQSINVLITLIWFINGLYCKLLNFVPRNQAIVARILGEEYSGIITKMIGLSEILMAIWVISGFRSRWCTMTQVLVIATMNLLEFFLAPDLLLFGKGNVILAVLLIFVVLVNEYLTDHLQNKMA